MDHRVEPAAIDAGSFEEFVDANERGLRHALVARLGGEMGREATSHALLYGLEHWNRVSVMDNPVGYLYRLGVRWGRRSGPRRLNLAVDTTGFDAWAEPGLANALAALPPKQRTAVVLRHASDWSYTQISGLMGISQQAARKNVERGLAALRKALEISDD